jgi:hypothetical protein
LWKAYSGTTGTSDWDMFDNMRGYCVPGASNDKRLQPNSSGAEGTVNIGGPTATGFTVENLNATSNYIYIAIRRGPMRTPTSGTSVFSPVSTAGNVSSITAGFPVDLALGKEVKNTTSYGNYAIDRLRGGSVLLQANTTSAEVTSQTFKFDSNTQFLQSGAGVIYGPSVYWLMRRAPGFFDVVCYTGTGAAATVTHNLAAVPEFMIVKQRGALRNWTVYSASISNANYLLLNQTLAQQTDIPTIWNSSNPTNSNFSLGSSVLVNASAGTYVAYLFATVTGVSKVFSFTGNGSSQTINCGFTSGARFVMIKRTDSTGDWYIWDSSRGIVSGNDPHLSLNTTAAEVTTDDTIDPDNSGFIVNQVTATNVNVNNATYIGLAIA